MPSSSFGSKLGSTRLIFETARLGSWLDFENFYRLGSARLAKCAARPGSKLENFRLVPSLVIMPILVENRLFFIFPGVPEHFSTGNGES